MSIVTKAIKTVRPSIADDATRLMRVAATHRGTRKLLNLAYGRLSSDAKVEVYSRFAKMFRDTAIAVDDGTWSVSFLGETLRLPIAARRAWLDWDAALSLLGHDHEVKTTYAAILRSRERPDLFVDVGANIGGHSLLFASQGIETIAVEPNDECRAYIREVTSLNGLDIEIAPVALGEREGFADLHFPERDTWLGTIDTVVRDELAQRSSLSAKRVEVTPLDKLIAGRAAERILIKVDVEGAELAVFKGAHETLSRRRPTILFECLPRQSTRSQVFDELDASGYAIAGLPWDGVSRLRSLERRAFVSDHGVNFVARPAFERA